MIHWGGEYGLSFHLLLTKADKLSRNQQVNILRETEQAVEGASVSLFSATKGLGVDSARTAIGALLPDTSDSAADTRI